MDGVHNALHLVVRDHIRLVLWIMGLVVVDGIRGCLVDIDLDILVRLHWVHIRICIGCGGRRIRVKMRGLLV